MARDTNIGIPPAPETTREVLEDLKVGENLLNIKDGVEENQEELKKIKLGVGLITGIDLDEEES